MKFSAFGVAAKVAAVLLASGLCMGCSMQAPPSNMPTPDTEAGASTPSEPAAVPVGEVTREEIEAGFDEPWSTAFRDAAPDARETSRLARVAAGAEVTVFFGTWCGDSRRELTRLWRALDEAAGEMPFTTRLVAVDRSKSEPEDLIEGAHLLYVPTFVVHRDGREIGRVVESSPNGIEADLASLLDGSAAGVLTDSRPELRETPDVQR